MARQHIATLPVDAGCIMLIDPCYVRETNESWYMGQVVYRNEENDGQWHDVDGDNTRTSGVVVNTGGDGRFPVYIETNDEDKVVSMTILFR